jgi:hypothetical protein
MARVDTRHPDYAARQEEWRLLRDCEAGPDAVRDAGVAYLPIPDGFTMQPDGGVAMYLAYRTRARVPDIFAPTVRGMVGTIHKTETQIDGLEGTALEPLWERCSPDGETLEEFHQRITAEVLRMGRFGVLADAPIDGGEPYLTGYAAEAIINWDVANRSLVVLDETGLRQRTEFDWQLEVRHRVLRLRDGRYSQQVYEGEDRDRGGEFIFPAGRGRNLFEEIPFVTVGPNDLTLRVQQSPLVGIARSTIAIYQLDADYRHQLYMTGQETLFIAGIDDAKQLPKVVGAGAIHGLPMGAKAEYVGATGRGMEMHSKAIAEERAAAAESGAAMFEMEDSASESGKAKALRYAARTATLVTVSIASAKGLERSLRYAALFSGVDPETIIVHPNLKFLESRLTPQEVQALVAAWQAGGFSYETLYENLLRGEIANPERTAEDERELIDQEAPDLPLTDEDDELEATDEDVSDDELASMFDPSLLGAA